MDLGLKLIEFKEKFKDIDRRRQELSNEREKLKMEMKQVFGLTLDETADLFDVIEFVLKVKAAP